MLSNFSMQTLVCRGWPALLLFSLLSGLLAPAWADNPEGRQPTWFSEDQQGRLQVHFYFFWSQHCPHCQAALPFVRDLPESHPWVVVHTYELSNTENVKRYIRMAAGFNEDANSVPAFMFCRKMSVGFSSRKDSGQFLEEHLLDCYRQQQAEREQQTVKVEAEAPKTADMTAEETIPAAASEINAATPPGEEQAAAEAQTESDDLEQPPPNESKTEADTGQSTASPDTAAKTEKEQGEVIAAPLSLPLLGEIRASDLSLPVYTLVIAGLDAFNPCAFFVLLFLLSLLVHARNRARMLFIGGVFVFFSGFIYFLFMAAWLNVFLFMGELRLVTLLAGAVAVLIALLNIKDYFYLKQGPSLSIPDTAKPGLYRRMRGLLNADNLPALLLGTVTLAVAANAYELLCTSGFPMVYTRLLTLEDLSTPTYYLYLVFYNVVYVIPLLIIVLAFTYTLGAHKLQEREGRVLKLISGLMMLGLGLVLLLAPDLLNNILSALGILAVAVVLGLLAYFWEKRLSPPTPG